LPKNQLFYFTPQIFAVASVQKMEQNKTKNISTNQMCSSYLFKIRRR